jgi:thiosulfate/3-mercaptopyruvate sulfurtransferase
MKSFKISILAVLSFILLAPVANAQSEFISSADLMTAIKDKNLVMVCVDKDKNYEVSHITGSIHLDQKSLMKTGEPEGILKTPAELAKIFGGKGISENNMIVLYDDGKNKYTGRVYWVLKYLGAKNVRILTKDLAEWRKVRIPITKTPTTLKAVTFTPTVNKAIFTDYEYVKSNIDNASVVLLDVRAVNEFNGTSTDPVSKGHIKGAKNIEWSDVLTATGNLKTDAELKKLFESKGITKDKTIVLYCGTSVRAGIVFLALKHLGYQNVKVYDGAYNEWVFKGGAVVK